MSRHVEGKGVSPGMPADTDTVVAWTEPAAPYLYAGAVAPLPAPFGFGAATTGGAWGEVLHVHKVKDQPDDPKPHSLRWAVEKPGPTWIVFDENLSIDLAAPLALTSDTTLDGRGHKVSIAGHVTCGGLEVHDVENVIVHGLTLSGFGDPELVESNDPHDAISVVRARRVWVDHCDLSHASDKTLGIGDGASQITVTANRFHDQKQTLQVGNMTTANASVDCTVTVAHNHFDRCAYRMPVTSYGKAHVLNNYIDTWGQYAVRSQRLAQTYLEGNVFQAGEAPKATTIETGGQTANDAGSLEDDRPGWLYDCGNLYLGKCKKQSTGTEHMFDPHLAYDYPVELATQELGAWVASTAGPAGVAV